MASYPASLQKKKPHLTIARGAGALHRPRFPDAREKDDGGREVVPSG